MANVDISLLIYERIEISVSLGYQKARVGGFFLHFS